MHHFTASSQTRLLAAITKGNSMARGRKRKTGKRERNGRASRAGIARHDKGNPVTERKMELYGVNGSDAIGRAYEAGLLGDKGQAKPLLDTARAISRAYWAWYINGPIRCTLADRTSGAGIDGDADRERKQEQWLDRMLKIAGPMGFERRRAFDELVIDPQPDSGPSWLDSLLADRTNKAARKWLDLAMSVLCECADVQQKPLTMAA